MLKVRRLLLERLLLLMSNSYLIVRSQNPFIPRHNFDWSNAKYKIGISSFLHYHQFFCVYHNVYLYCLIYNCFFFTWFLVHDYQWLFESQKFFLYNSISQKSTNLFLFQHKMYLYYCDSYSFRLQYWTTPCVWFHNNFLENIWYSYGMLWNILATIHIFMM